MVQFSGTFKYRGSIIDSDLATPWKYFFTAKPSLVFYTSLLWLYDKTLQWQNLMSEKVFVKINSFLLIF